MFSKTIFSGYHQSVKQFGSRSGPTNCWVWFWSKLFTKVISFDAVASCMPSAAFNIPTNVFIICDFIWPFLRPYMGVIPHTKMAFIFPISCILVLIFPIFMIYFPKCEGKGSPGLQIRGGKGYFSIDFLEFSIEN